MFFNTDGTIERKLSIYRLSLGSKLESTSRAIGAPTLHSFLKSADHFIFISACLNLNWRMFFYRWWDLYGFKKTGYHEYPRSFSSDYMQCNHLNITPLVTIIKLKSSGCYWFQLSSCYSCCWAIISWGFRAHNLERGIIALSNAENMPWIQICHFPFACDIRWCS